MLLWFSFVFVFFCSFSLERCRRIIKHPTIYPPIHIHAHHFLPLNLPILFCLFVWFHARLFVYNRVPCFTTLILSDGTNNCTIYHEKMWNWSEWTGNTWDGLDASRVYWFVNYLLSVNFGCVKMYIANNSSNG